jgi:phosphoglycolate phosphatase-like HAD superfamily hydrolase
VAKEGAKIQIGRPATVGHSRASKWAVPSCQTQAHLVNFKPLFSLNFKPLLTIKPKPYFLHRAAEDHGVDLSRSFSIGDHPHDAELACSVGGTGIYVLTGHGRKHRDRLPEGYIVVEGIAEAIEWIITQTKDW